MALINEVTASLAPYPMEELTRIRMGLIKRGQPVFDFGTGDPKIPTWAPIREAIVNAIPTISQYPSVKGSEALHQAQLGYFERRFGIKRDPSWTVIPSQGSKEAVFNIALCLVPRNGAKKRIIYPDPGYPVYRSSTLFAGGVPTPVRLEASDRYLLKPWTLPESVQSEACAIWINYPHNPTGYTAPRDYWEEVIAWAHKRDVTLLSDDCYIDIYDPEIDAQLAATTKAGSAVTWHNDPRPLCPLAFSTDRVITFMSLSKRSGLTGYRSGLIAGDTRILQPFLRARANFGVGSPDFVQAGAVVAWQDDTHVAERRNIFAHRLKMVVPRFQELSLINRAPEAEFYLWCRIPERFKDDDVACCLKLAELGVITSPSQWLSEGIRGFVRFALVPDDAGTLEAMDIVTKFVRGV